MNISSYPASVCSNVATQFKARNATIPRKGLKAFLFCAIVTALSIVPLNPAAGQSHGIAIIGPNTSSEPYPCTSVGINNAIGDAIARRNGITAGVVDARNCTSMTGAAFNTEIDVGNSSDVPVTLLLPGTGSWVASINDPTFASYAIARVRQISSARFWIWCRYAVPDPGRSRL